MGVSKGLETQAFRNREISSWKDLSVLGEVNGPSPLTLPGQMLLECVMAGKPWLLALGDREVGTAGVHHLLSPRAIVSDSGLTGPGTPLSNQVCLSVGMLRGWTVSEATGMGS